MRARILRRILVEKSVDEVIREFMQEGYAPISVRADGSGATFQLFNKHENVDGPTDMQMRVGKALGN